MEGSKDNGHSDRTESFFVNDRGHKLFQQSWTPKDKDPLAVVLFFHGICEYSSRYIAFFEELSSRGYVVHTYDHQSHGNSAGPDHYIRHLNDMIDDGFKFATTQKQIAPSLPHIAIGYSLGGLIALQLLMRHPNLFDAIVLLAPSTKKPPMISNLLYYTGKVIAPWIPWFRPRPMDISTLSRDPVVCSYSRGSLLLVKSYVEDPIVWHCKIPILLGSSIFSVGDDALANAEKLYVPYLMFQGTADTMVSVEGVEELHARASSKDKTLIIMKDLFHELLHEPEKEDILGAIFDWLKQRVTPEGFKAAPDELALTRRADTDGHGHLIWHQTASCN